MKQILTLFPLIFSILLSQIFNSIEVLFNPVQSEPILIFTEAKNGLVQYILSEFLFIGMYSIGFHYSNEVDSIVHELKSKCISFGDEWKLG